MRFFSFALTERLCQAACGLCLALFALSCIEPQWIERWFDQSPDGGDGNVERWLAAGAFLTLAMISAWLAQRFRNARLAA